MPDAFGEERYGQGLPEGRHDGHHATAFGIGIGIGIGIGMAQSGIAEREAVPAALYLRMEPARGCW